MSEQNNEPQRTPQTTVSQRVDQFISAVDRTLAEGGMGADERENIVGDLRVQIEEMLSARATSSGKAATIEDVEAVLSELDPPESYSQGEGAKESKTGQPREEHERGCGPGRERGHWHGRGRGRHGGPYWFWKKRRVAEAVRRAIHSFSPFGHPAFMGMTDRARNALALAKMEARRLQHDFIGTEHLLLGLIQEKTGVAGKVLDELGVTLNRAREETARLVAPGTVPNVQERLPLTPRLRQAIEEGRLQARNLGHDFVGTEHLLLGLLDVPAVAPMVLKNLGLDLDEVRESVFSHLPATAKSHTIAPPAAPTYWPAGAAQPIKAGGNEYRIIAAGSDTGGVYAAIEATLASPDGLGVRKHTREDISVYVLEGAARLKVQGRIVELNKGDFSRIPRGAAHEIEPTDGPARLMLIVSPAGVERMIEALSQVSGPEAVREVAVRFGVTTA